MHRTNHDRINGAVSNQLPAESLIDMIVNTQTYRLGNECCAVLYICTGLQKYKKKLGVYSSMLDTIKNISVLSTLLVTNDENL